MPLATRLPTAWQRTLPLLLALIGWILFWYWETLSAMVGIWERSDTYAHAFIVPPIALWLIWRKRDELLALQPNASGWLAIPLAVATFLWLLGQLTAVNALTQFALVVTLILAIMSLLGLKISRHIAFPLLFLLFSVPIGDFMMPKLMDWTAAFTVTGAARNRHSRLPGRKSIRHSIRQLVGGRSMQRHPLHHRLGHGRHPLRLSQLCQLAPTPALHRWYQYWFQWSPTGCAPT